MRENKQRLIFGHTLEELGSETDVAAPVNTSGRNLTVRNDGHLAVFRKQSPKGKEAVHTKHEALHAFAEFIDLRIGQTDIRGVREGSGGVVVLLLCHALASLLTGEL